MTTVAALMAQPSHNHEPRPSRTRVVTLVNELRFDRLSLQAGARVELVEPPQVVTADGRRFELERVAS